MDNSIFYIWLHETANVSAHRAMLALENFGTAENIYNASEQELKECNIFSKQNILHMKNKSLDEAQKIIDKCNKSNIQILTTESAQYPDKLREIYDAPTVLYVRGTMPDFDNIPAVAIVGQRKAKARGLEAAHMFAQVLSAHGFTIISGLAMGIDSAAHRGAVEGKTPTVAVFGTAIDMCYPADNASLLQDILDGGGAAISEYAPSTRGYPSNFPARNRIVSALSSAVLVVEAPRKSGSLITASYALEQGKDIFAIPGFIDRPEYEGSNALIQSGAYLASSPVDIIRMYSGRYPFISQAVEEYLPRPEKKADTPKIPTETKRLPSLTPQETTVLKAIEGKVHTDEICQKTQLPISQVLISLTMLQIKGAVRECGAKYFETI